MLEIKEILDSTVTRVEADPNKLHQDELRTITNGYTPEDAEIAAEVLARRYPTILLNALSKEMSRIKTKMENISDIMSRDREEDAFNEYS